MALGRPRNNKRSSSSSSYTSMVTTVLFIALCVFCIWMLTSDSILPPRPTTRTATTSPIDTPKVTRPTTRFNRTKDPPAFEDNPGDLPLDAIKSDDEGGDGSRSQRDKKSESLSQNLKDSNVKNVGDGTNEKQDSLPGLQGKESAEEQEKQRERKDQIGDENSSAQTQKPTETSLKGDSESEENKRTGNEESDGNQKVEEQNKKVEEGNQKVEEQNQKVEERNQKVEERNQKVEEQNQKVEEQNQKVEERNQKFEEGNQKVEEQNQKVEEGNQKGEEGNQKAEEGNQKAEEGNQKAEEGNQKVEEGTTTQEKTKISEDSKNSQESENQKPDDRDQQQDGVSHANKNLQDTQNRVTVDDDQVQRLKEQLREDQSREDTQETRKEEQQSDETSDEKSGTKQPQIEFPDVTREGSQRTGKPVNDQEPQTTEAEKREAQKQEENEEAKPNESNSGEAAFPGGASAVIPKESKESKKSWSTQAAQSLNQKERRKGDSTGNQSIYGHSWQLCNVTAGADYIPCLDNEKALKKLRSTKHFQHRERHCPEEGPTCLVPLPENYKTPIEWPKSREKIWYHNVPHAKLAEVKGHQNWVKMTGEFLTFPGGGTQFIHGALHYIDYLQQSVPEIAWGKHTRVILDVGCGVASFGGFLFDRDVLTMSFAPKDEHEAQVQFALERGIPAISAVMGSQRLPFPSRVFDVVHCARCRVPWHVEGGMLLLELNRVLRPGGYFVWSATPVYQKLQEDVEIWNAMKKLTASLCWELVVISKDKVNKIGAAIFRKPTTNDCYDQRKQNRPPMCKDDDDPNAAWYVPLQSCMHRVPVDEAERGTQWPEAWPRRLQTPPYWLNGSQMGIYGKPAPQDFAADHKHWKHVVSKSYMTHLGITWSNVRNVMDMRAVYGGFAAALRDLKVWVMNVVNVDSPDTLPIIYERGLFGIYHDWCESFSTYPRSYDLLHADHLFSKLKKRCKLTPVMAEVDRIVRPGGKIIVRDESSTIGEIENLLKSLHWEVRLTFSKNKEGLLSAQKGYWRPETNVESS